MVVKDLPAKYRAAMTPFTKEGYRRVPSMPGCVLDLDFASFEEFMSARLGANFGINNQLNKQAPILMEVVSDVTPTATEIRRSYLQT